MKLVRQGLSVLRIQHQVMKCILSASQLWRLSPLSRGGTIDPADASYAIATFKNDLQNEYNIVEVTETLVNRAITLAETHGLRGYDAVQLAAAYEVNLLCTASGLLPLTFVSADTELTVAATTEGLTVDDPNLHLL